MTTKTSGLLESVEDIRLRVTQAILASKIGKKKDRTEFLRGELERIGKVADAAIIRATGQ